MLCWPNFCLEQPLSQHETYVTVIPAYSTKLPAAGAPSPLMVLAGMLPWTFFSTALSDAFNGLMGRTL